MTYRPRHLLCLTAIIGWMLPVIASGATRPLTIEDVVILDRVSDPQIAPDGKSVVFVVRETNLDANRGVQSLWRLMVQGTSAQAERLTARGTNDWDPHWSPDGNTLYFLSDRSGQSQVWRLDRDLGEARPVTHLPVDVENFKVSPDGRSLALSLAVFPDCADIACTAKRLTDRTASKASGQLYQRMFVRHWDSWNDGRQNQLFIAKLNAQGTVNEEPTALTRSLDADIPSKPFGDDAEYVFSPDSQTIYAGARIAGVSEPWSTNFDVYAIAVSGATAPRNLTADNPAWDAHPLPSADGKKLYYLAMRVPGAEADRFHVMELDLATGTRREVAPSWDRSAGPLQLSADGKALYTTADDHGIHALFSIDIASGQVQRLTNRGHVGEFAVHKGVTIVSLDSLKGPADLYRLMPAGALTSLTAFNAKRLDGVAFSEAERFSFAGWNGETVEGYVMKPFGYTPGKKYPVAFLIHGGPQGSWLDSFSYRWNPQTYAGLGFAVVTIDFHGSTGYGQAFTDSISQHWGDRPLEDLKKGWAAALARYSFLDGGNACALGASYGGFMINWIAGHWATPASGAWKCLVNHDGIFDSRSMYYTTEELWFEEHENGGTPWQHPDQYEAFNPSNAVADWRIPMMVVQGVRDYRVPIGQGIGTFTALQRRGIPSELLVFPDENHWVLKPQNSVEWHHTVEAWLRRWTAP
jgi:dipeptidyl aminopeptidase/acylaminoacyl peptidase